MTPHTHGSTGSWWLHFTGLLAASLFACVLVSCGGGDDDKSGGRTKKGDPAAEEAAGADLYDLEDEVGDLKTQAVKAGMKKLDAPRFKRAESLIADAEDAIDDGNETSAKKKLVLAKNTLKSFLAERDRAREAAADLAALREKVDAAKKKADESNSAQYASDLYKQATEAYDDAVAMLGKAATTKEVAMAERGLEQAEAIFGQAASQAEQNLSYKTRAEEAKKQLGEYKTKAEALGAKDKAAPQWLDASNAESNADDVFTRGEFQMAVASYQDAARRFADVIATIQQQEQMAKAMEDARKAHEAYAAQQAAAAEGQSQPGAAVVDPNAPVAPPPGGLVTDPNEAMGDLPGALADPGTAVPQVRSIAVMDGYDPEQYPQEIDADDEAFLQLHYKKLTKSGRVEYDPQTGAVAIDYSASDDVKQDLLKVGTSMVEYKHPFQQPAPVGLPGQPVPQQRAQTPFSFAGNTQGFVLFPVPFKYYVRTEYYLHIVTMDMKGTFAATVMYNARKRGGYAAQWLSVGAMQGSVPKVGGAPPPYNQVADRWFDKTRPVPMKAEFQMPDPRKGGDPLRSGLFTITYDVGGEKEALNALPSKKYDSGMVGFHWNRTKFELKGLQITGILDKKTAVMMLRKKLKMPKEKTSTSKAGSTPGGEANTADSPAEAGTTARKIGGNFDF